MVTIITKQHLPIQLGQAPVLPEQYLLLQLIAAVRTSKP
jgi:hypothetical protein